MEIIKSILLGIVQGLTEFLPISSSGHLEIFKVILGFETGLNNNILFTLMLHLATSFSVIVVYWKDIKKIFKSIFSIKKDENTYFFSLILISIFPAGIVGFLFEEKISNLFDGNMILVGSMLLFTSIILFISDFKIKTTNKLDYVKSFFVGVSQALAIIPGISRSGLTICSSVLMGVNRELAAKFSFLMVLPLIFGSFLKILIFDEIIYNQEIISSYVFGFLSAFISGIFACKWMILLVKKSKMKYFSLYCLTVGLICIFFSL
tara:strand:+ start:333 stop:1121 length:789 start_codon:yes stop_codon:yes gene_type:complete